MIRYRTVIAAIALIAICSLSIPAVGGEDTMSKKRSLGAETIAPPSPVWVIGSYDAAGKPNMMTASWVGVCCSRPPCVMIALREATYTHGNITKSQAFTVNMPPERYAAETAYFGRVSGRDEDKLAATGLTAVRGDSLNAPYLDEFPLVIECAVIKTIELGLHTMFIAEIKDVKASESVLDESGMPDLEKLGSFVFSYGSGGFYGTGGFLGTASELAEGIKQ